MKEPREQDVVSDDDIAKSGIYAPESEHFRVVVHRARVERNGIYASVEGYALNGNGSTMPEPLAYADDFPLGNRYRREELLKEMLTSLPEDEAFYQNDLRLLYEDACRRVRRAVFSSDYNSPSSEQNLNEEIELAQFQRHVIKIGTELEIEYLPTLNREDIIRKGQSNLLIGGPKLGKTEWLVRVVQQWTDEKVLIVSEEPKLIWAVRVSKYPLGAFDHCTLIVAPKWGQRNVMERLRRGDETVVIIDSVAGIFTLENENDNAEVANELMPLCGFCASRNQTFIPVHHARKSPGEHGTRARGASAFLAAVDVWLEIDYTQTYNRRVLSGQGRLVNPPTVLYELLDDGSMVFVGTPEEATLEMVKAVCLEALSCSEWMKTPKVVDAVKARDCPASYDQIVKALKELAAPLMDEETIELASVERDPPIGQMAQGGKAHQWRRICSDNSSDASSDEYNEGSIPALTSGDVEKKAPA